MRRFAALIVAACLVATLPAAAQPVVVASKIDTEGALLGNLIVAALTRAGIPLTSRIQLGPTEILRKALLAGQIDLYPEYTGNGATFFRREDDPVWRDPEQGYATVRQVDFEENQLVWLAPAPANNTWAIAVRGDLASANRLGTLDDFARFVSDGGKVKLAGSAEFVGNPGALPAFQAAYGFKLRRSQLLVLAGGDTAATIRAAAEGTSGVNAAMAYGTDGALAVLGLVALADDKKVQIVYRPAPVVRVAALERHPEISHVLEPVFARLTLSVLRDLNAKIAVEGFDAQSVAAAFLSNPAAAR